MDALYLLMAAYSAVFFVATAKRSSGVLRRLIFPA